MDQVDSTKSSWEVDFPKVFRDLPVALMALDRELRFVEANECYLAMVSSTRKKLIGRHIFEAFPESGERLTLFRDAFERALSGETVTLERQPYAIADEDGVPRDIWWSTRQSPVYDRDGAVIGLVQHAQDITSEVQAEQMRDVVLREIDHRMKNQLATISAIARRTASDAEDKDDFLESFDRRIQAMSRTHQMLVDGRWSGLSLGDLVISELSPYRDGHDDRIVIEGPPVTLSPAEAQTLGLALHELSTNAAKYGALSEGGKSLKVHWSNGDGQVRLRWIERALNPIKPPTREGFGSIIVEKLLPRQIGATVQRDYRPDGLHCSIDIPR